MLVATSSSRMIVRNFWQDSKTGASYQVQVQVPTQRMDSPQQAETIPMEDPRLERPCCCATLPGGTRGPCLANMIGLPCSVISASLPMSRAKTGPGRSVGRRTLWSQAGTPPRGVRVETRGQIAPMREMFTLAGDRPGCCRGRHPGAAHGLFRIAADGSRFHWRGAWRAQRRGLDAPGHEDDAQHRIVHGNNHEHRRIGVQFGDVGHLHGP